MSASIVERYVEAVDSMCSGGIILWAVVDGVCGDATKACRVAALVNAFADGTTNARSAHKNLDAVILLFL